MLGLLLCSRKHASCKCSLAQPNALQVLCDSRGLWKIKPAQIEEMCGKDFATAFKVQGDKWPGNKAELLDWVKDTGILCFLCVSSYLR